MEWDSCVNKDFDIDGTAANTVPNVDLIDCSYECLMDTATNCLLWAWNAQTRVCSLFDAEAEQMESRHNYNGEKQCVGKVSYTNTHTQHTPWIDGTVLKQQTVHCQEIGQN